MANSLIPYSFVPGTKAMASEVNANFLALANSVEEGKQYTDESIEKFNTELEARLEEYDGFVAEKLQPNLSNSLNISNCIIEQPQRIRYTLEKTKLTIKAGSVVIVPYGIVDLREKHPIGSTFISENFKVVDTQFTSKGFFVWAELQKDISNTNTSATTSERQPYLYLNGSLGGMVNMESGTSNTASSIYTIYYNTATNRIGVATNTTTISYDNVISFPFMRVMGNSQTYWADVLQVFNGMGFIGNTFWLDKGVKVLMPDGFNTDGTYKNIQYVSEALLLNTFDKSSTWTRNRQPMILYRGTLSTNVSSNRYYEAYSDPDSKSTYVTWLNLSDNTMYHAETTAGDYQKITACFLGYIDVKLGKIISFSPRQVLKVADIYEVQRLIQAYNTVSKATNGYVKLGDGIIIQWGQHANGTVTLPVPFSMSSFRVALSTQASQGSHYGATIESKTTTTFKLVANYSYTSDWIAIGY